MNLFNIIRIFRKAIYIPRVNYSFHTKYLFPKNILEIYFHEKQIVYNRKKTTIYFHHCVRIFPNVINALMLSYVIFFIYTVV